MKKQLINLAPVRELVKHKLIEKYDSTTFMNTDSIDIKLDIKEILDAHIQEKHLIEPKIFITTDAYVKMRKLVDDTSTEIGWYGTVTKAPGFESVYIIEDILVYPQKVTGATCEQDDDKMFEFEMSLSMEQVNHKRFQGHSHVNMGVTPSGVDEQFYQDLLTQVNDYFIITITNKRNEYTVRFYDIENNILYSELPIEVLLSNGSALSNWYNESKEKLSNRTVITNTTVPYKNNKSTYDAFDQMKMFSGNPYDDYDDEEELVWDSRFGYISKAEQRYYDRELNNLDHKRKRGRPKKGR